MDFRYGRISTNSKQKAIKILLQFSTSYLCKLGFSYLNNIKNKKRERLLNIEEELIVCLSHICPNIAVVVKKHQAQLYHWYLSLLFNTRYYCIQDTLVYGNKIFLYIMFFVFYCFIVKNPLLVENIYFFVIGVPWKFKELNTVLPYKIGLEPLH